MRSLFFPVPALLFWFSACLAAQNSGDASLRKVPDLQGRQPNLALQTLRLLELRSQQGVFYISPKSWRDEIAPGTVQMQSQQPGTLILSGSTIAIWTFEKAPANAKALKMPDLRKLSRKEAIGKLRGAGLSPMRDEIENSATLDDALVEDQYPRPEQSVFEGTSVYLKLAR